MQMTTGRKPSGGNEAYPPSPHSQHPCGQALRQHQNGGGPQGKTEDKDNYNAGRGLETEQGKAPDLGERAEKVRDGPARCWHVRREGGSWAQALMWPRLQTDDPEPKGVQMCCFGKLHGLHFRLVSGTDTKHFLFTFPGFFGRYRRADRGPSEYLPPIATARSVRPLRPSAAPSGRGSCLCTGPGARHPRPSAQLGPTRPLCTKPSDLAHSQVSLLESHKRSERQGMKPTLLLQRADNKTK